jgi:hypothetical protein
MRRLPLAIAAPIILAIPASAANLPQSDPLRFFAGRTETRAIVKVIFHSSYRSHSLGEGRIESDGSLTLLQRVEDEGKPPHDRRWRVRQTGPGRWIAAMSEANSPVTIDQVGARYRFRFTMAGHLNVEQWLTPLPGAASALTDTRVRKFGMTVATTDGIVRKF